MIFAFLKHLRLIVDSSFCKKNPKKQRSLNILIKNKIQKSKRSLEMCFNKDSKFTGLCKTQTKVILFA